jgi:hypothetical protein
MTRTPRPASSSAAPTNRGIEELHLVDTDDRRALHVHREKLRRARDRHGVGVDALMRDDLHFVVAVVDAWLEELHALPSQTGALDASQELFRLAAEHRAADDLDAARRAASACVRLERHR